MSNARKAHDLIQPDLPRSAPEVAAGRPEPGRFWIRFWPRRWPGREGWWVHLAQGGCGSASPADTIDFELGARGLTDVVYLPPVEPRQSAARDTLVEEGREAGVPILVHLFPGDPPPRQASHPIYDPLDTLLRGDLDGLDEIPAGAAVVWPLIAGLTTDPELWEEGCRRLKRRKVGCVQALSPLLTPAERRRLVESRAGKEQEDEVFNALFHGAPPAERDFVRTASRYGLTPFLPRPLPSFSPRLTRNRQISGLLALAGELWLRLGRLPSVGQGFYRAARWIDQSSYDVMALAREGNLGVLGWLESSTRPLVEEWMKTGRVALLDELLDEYSAAEEE